MCNPPFLPFCSYPRPPPPSRPPGQPTVPPSQPNSAAASFCLILFFSSTFSRAHLTLFRSLSPSRFHLAPVRRARTSPRPFPELRRINARGLAAVCSRKRRKRSRRFLSFPPFELCQWSEVGGEISDGRFSRTYVRSFVCSFRSES